MACRKCGSHSLWDDALNGWWGCHDCKAVFSPDVTNSTHPADTWTDDPPPKKTEEPNDD